MTTVPAIASSKRAEFRRACRSHPKWKQCRSTLDLPKDPSNEQFIQAAEYLGIDITPYIVDEEPTRRRRKRSGGKVEPKPSWKEEPATEAQVSLIREFIQRAYDEELEQGGVRIAKRNTAFNYEWLPILTDGTSFEFYDCDNARIHRDGSGYNSSLQCDAVCTNWSNRVCRLTKWNASGIIAYIVDNFPKHEPEETKPEPKGKSEMTTREQLLQELLTGGIDERRVLELIETKIDTTESRLIELVKTHSREPLRIEITRPGEKEARPIEGTVHKAFKECLDVLQAGFNLQLVGPMGSGKSTLAEQLHDAIHGDDFEFSYAGALTQDFKVFGFVDAHGTYRSTPFYHRYVEGGTMFFDELDGGLPNTVLSLNTPLAGNQCDFPHGCFPKHEEFTCISACNTWSLGADRQYVGRYQQDAAATDRWVQIEIDYDEDLEFALAGGNEDWARRVQAYRQAANDLRIRVAISPRTTMRGAAFLEKGWKRDRVEDVLIWRGMEADTVQKIKQAARV